MIATRTKHRAARITTWAFLGAATVVAITLPDALPRVAAVPGLGDTIELHGIVRDFRRAHVDFDKMPGHGYGHYAGNVEHALNNYGRPVLAGGGFKVSAQWHDVNGNPIPPHLYAPFMSAQSSVVELKNSPTLSNSPVLDSFDSGAGPYGGANVGPAPTVQTGAAMPIIIVPSTGDFQTAYTRSGGIHTINADMRCNDFELDGATIFIDGDVTIVASQRFSVTNQSEIRLLAGATLTIYAGSDFLIQNEVKINANTGDHRRATIYRTAVGSYGHVENFCEIYASLVFPDSELRLRNSAHAYGRFVGKDLFMENSPGLHIDTRPLVDPEIVCGNPINDTAGTAGPTATGGINNALTFDQWFADRPGANLSVQYSITLVENASGVFEYVTDSFHPIDGRLLLNEGQAHNYNLTYAIQASFVYDECAGQFFEFAGSDDAWLFVGGNLAMDLGGIIPGTAQYVEMDRLGLTDGETYQVSFFYAQRQSLEAGFSMRTNIPFATTAAPAVVTMEYD
jgi:fibro-slime domain-containing protein